MELSLVENLHNKYSDKGLSILAICTDDEVDKSERPEHLKDLPYHWLLGNDREFKTRALGTNYSLPRSFLLDRENRLILQHADFVPGDEKHFDRLIKVLLED